MEDTDFIFLIKYHSSSAGELALNSVSSEHLQGGDKQFSFSCESPTFPAKSCYQDTQLSTLSRFLCVCVVAHMPCEQLRGTLQRACFLLQSYETWGWNSGPSQSWWQAPFPNESSHWPCFSSLSHPHQWACGACLYPRSLAQEVD